MEYNSNFFLKKVGSNFSKARYSLAFYNYDLIKINEETKETISNPNGGTGLFSLFS